MLVVLWRITLNKSVYGVRQGADMKLISRYKSTVEFLVATREENQEVMSPNIPREVNDKDIILENLDGAILDSQLSWSTVISSLVIMGELCASFSPESLHMKDAKQIINSYRESTILYWQG